MAAAARAAAQWEAWVENSAKAASTAAAGKVVGAGAVVVRVEVSSAELEGRPAEAAVKAAISVPYLARTVAGMAWAGTVAAVGARTPRFALPAPTTHALGTNGPPTRRFQVLQMGRSTVRVPLTGSLVAIASRATNNNDNNTSSEYFACRPRLAPHARSRADDVRKRVRSYGLLDEPRKTARRAAAWR